MEGTGLDPSIKIVLGMIDEATAPMRQATSNIDSSLKNVDTSLKNVDRSAQQFNATLSRIQRTITAFIGVMVFQQMVQSFQRLVEIGIDYNKTMETAKIGISSILAAQGEFVDQQGRSLTIQQQINAAYGVSADLIKQLEADNLRTIATMDQLVKAFQAALAPGLSVGLDIDQVREYTVAMVQAAGALQVNLDMLAEEMRSLLTGTITPRNTLIATYLGITNDDIAQYKGDAQGLFDFLMGELKAFGDYGIESQKTFAGLFSNVADVVKKAAGISTQGFFDELKQMFSDLYDYIVVIDEQTGEIVLNDEIVEIGKQLNTVLIETTHILKDVALLMVDAFQSEAISSVVNAVGTLASTLTTSLKYDANSVLAFLSLLLGVTKSPKLGTIGLIIAAYNELSNETRDLTKTTDEMRKKLYEAIPPPGKWEPVIEQVDAFGNVIQKQGETWEQYQERVSEWSRRFELAFSDEHEAKMLAAKTNIDYLAGSARDLAEALKELAEARDAFDKLADEISRSAFDALAESQKKLELVGKSAEETINIEAWSKYVDEVTKIYRKAEDLKMSPEQAAQVYAVEIEMLAKARDNTIEAETATYRLEEAEKAKNRAIKDGQRAMKDMTSATKEYSDAMSNAVDRFNEISGQITTEFDMAGLDAISAKFAELPTESAAAMREWNETYKTTLEALGKALEKGVIDQERFLSTQQAMDEETKEYAKSVDELQEKKERLLAVEEKIDIARLALDYAELTGTMKDQIQATIDLIDVEMAQLAVEKQLREEALAKGRISQEGYDYAEQAASIERLILVEKRHYQELRKTGSLLDGLSYGFQQMGRNAETSFDIGIDLANDLYSAIGEVFDSVLTGERDIEDAFADMADAILAAIAKIATQQIIIPVLFDVTGLSSLTGGSSSAAISSAVSGVYSRTIGGQTTSGSSGLSFGGVNILGGDWLSSFLGTELFSFGGGAGSTGSLGLLNAGFTDAAAATGQYTLTMGGAITALGGLTSAAFGITDLINGDWASGISSTLGGGLMMASLIPGLQFLAPIGAAVSLLGSLFGGLFQEEPKIEMDMGPEFGEDLFEISGDIEDDAKKQVEDAIYNYFDSLEEAFDIDIADIIQKAGVTDNWTIKGEDEIGEITDLAGRWLDDFWRGYSGRIADAIFGEGMPFNNEFFEGLGLSWYGMEEGELSEQITEILGYLYALEQGGVDVNKALNELKFNFFEAGGNPFEDLGEFFQNLQQEGEDIGATMARVIGTLDVIPDGMERMQALVAGIDFTSVQTYLDQLTAVGGEDYASWIVQTIIGNLTAGISNADTMKYFLNAGLDAAGMAIVRQATEVLYKGMAEGMSEEEAYQLLENQLTFASDIMLPAIDSGMAAALESGDLDAFKASFTDTLEANMIAAVTQVAMQDIFEQLLTTTFGDFGNFYDLIDSFMAGDIGLDEFDANFTAIMTGLGPKLEEVYPYIQQWIDMVGKWSDDTDDAVDGTTDKLDELTQQIYDLRQAAASTIYDLESTIYDLTSGANYDTLLSTARTGTELSWAQYEGAETPEGQISALDDLKGWFDKIYDVRKNQIQSSYQAEIDAQEALKDSTQSYYEGLISAQEALKDSTQSYYEGLIDAKQDELDALSDLRSETQDYYNERLDALNEELQIAEAFQQVVEQVHGTIQDLLTSDANPADVFEQLSISQAEVDRLRGLWQGSTGEAQAEYASQLADAIRSYIELAGEAYQVPSGEYVDIFGGMLDLLGQIEDVSSVNADTTEYLQEQIANTTEEMNSTLDSIDAQEKALQAEIEALRNAEDAALAGIDSSIEALRAAEDAALSSIDTNIQSLNDQMDADLKALDTEFAEYYKQLEGWYIKAYEAQDDALSTELQSLQMQTETAKALYRANFQLDAIYGMLGSLNSTLAGAAGYDTGIDYVPQTQLAWLHPGERVLTAADNAIYLNGGSTREGAVTNNYYFYAGDQTISAGASDKAERIGEASRRMTKRDFIEMMKDPEIRKQVQELSRGR